jgi:porphobilinogen synthase
MSSDFSGESFQHLRSGFIPGTGTPAGAPQVNVEGLPIPPVRMRRLRRLPKLRAMVRETRLSVEQLVYPMFVCPGTKVRRDISSMPGCAQLSIDLLVEECKAVRDLGIPGVILFGIPEFKDEVGSQGYSPDGIVPMALRALKAEVPELLLWADVCLCEYTSHGHCGLLHDHEVANDPTLALPGEGSHCLYGGGRRRDRAVGHDGRARRGDARGAGPAWSRPGNSASSATPRSTASAYYGPFREAAESTPRSSATGRRLPDGPGNSPTRLSAKWQLDVAGGRGRRHGQARAALPRHHPPREATPCRVPVAAYNVSGEYSMINAAAAHGLD